MKPTNPNVWSFELTGGRLDVSVARSEPLLTDLIAVASRLNAKRPFLFVSKVLGKHWPVAPKVISQTHQALAQKLGPLEPPVVFIAMAETAIGLGRGVFESHAALSGEKELLFCHTTRYNLEKPIAFLIDEPHSHARAHLVYQIQDEPAKKWFNQARSLILIDDEISTGRTLLNLAQAFAAQCPGLKKIALTCLTNWLPDPDRQRLKNLAPTDLSYIALLDGSFNFTAQTEPLSAPEVRSVGDGRPMGDQLTVNYGRQGLTPAMARSLTQKAEKLAEAINPNSTKIRVVGTGEFLHEPFVVARRLEERGWATLFQSTTRTPLAVGGAIGHVLSFKDNYGEGLDNFLYNADPQFPGQTWVGFETAPDQNLLTLLNAKALRL
jgi:hypothetical protein